MPQGVYKRTKKHREDFKKRMHTPEIAKKRWESRRKNEAKVEIERSKIPVKDNKFDGSGNHINSLDREGLIDKVASIDQSILRKVKELAGNLKTLQNLQNERDKIETRLEELGMKF